jgi:hypothetical protein
MGLKDIFRRGKKAVDDRGGTEALKEDAKELKDVATEKGSSVADKAKDAAAAIRDPGRKGQG